MSGRPRPATRERPKQMRARLAAGACGAGALLVIVAYLPQGLRHWSDVRFRYPGIALLIAGAFVALAPEVERLRRGAVEGLRREWRAAGRLHLVALGAIVLVGLLVRLDFLFEPMRFDESYTYLAYASQPLRVGLTLYDVPNNHVFHTLLVHLSTGLFGARPWAVRFPAFCAGMLLIPAAYAAARALFDRFAGLLAAALVAGSAPLIEYSTNARGYSLVDLAFAIELALAVYLVRSTNRAAWLTFAVIGALGFYSVPIFGYGFAIVVVWLLAQVLLRAAGDRGTRLALLGGATAAAALLAALLYGRILGSVIRLARNGDFVSDPWAFAREVWAQWMNGVPVAGRIVLVAGALGSLFLDRRLRRAPPLLAAAAVVGVIVAAGRVASFTRVWLFLLVLFLVAAAGGLAAAATPARRLRARVPAAAGGVVAVVLAVLLAARAADLRSAYAEPSPLRSGEAIAGWVVAHLTTADRLVMTPVGQPTMSYYLKLRGAPPSFVTTAAGGLPPASGRTVVVVNTYAGETLPTTLAATGLPRSDSTGARLLRSFSGAQLYALRGAQR